VVLALAASVLAGVVSGSYAHNASAAAPARATLASSTETLGQRILDKEETRTGDWYVYGGTGPYVFDCSGLVYWAATSLGLKNWPRTTYELLASPRLERIPLASATRGDLMFYGSGHVEMNTVWYHQTFGAQTWGTRVGWHAWNSYWEPTMAYRILW
jgi:cell wall-associated NlpC family hydrolase